MEIRVEGSLDQAMRVLKRKLAKEGVFKEMKKRAFYEKPSVRRKRKRSEAQRRGAKSNAVAALPRCSFSFPPQNQPHRRLSGSAHLRPIVFRFCLAAVQ